jgi:hypothetical protein
MDGMSIMGIRNEDPFPWDTELPSSPGQIARDFAEKLKAYWKEKDLLVPHTIRTHRIGSDPKGLIMLFRLVFEEMGIDRHPPFLEEEPKNSILKGSLIPLPKTQPIESEDE